MSIYLGNTPIADSGNGKADVDLANLTATGLSKLGPTNVYHVSGKICDSVNTSAAGVGYALVLLYPNGAAVIHYFIKGTVAGTTTDFDWGLSPSLLHSLNNSIPLITPVDGTCTFIDTSSGVINTTSTAYGGYLANRSSHWNPGRVYDVSGTRGLWASSHLTTTAAIYGVAFGTYSV